MKPFVKDIPQELWDEVVAEFMDDYVNSYFGEECVVMPLREDIERKYESQISEECLRRLNEAEEDWWEDHGRKDD